MCPLINFLHIYFSLVHSYSSTTGHSHSPQCKGQTGDRQISPHLTKSPPISVPVDQLLAQYFGFISLVLEYYYEQKCASHGRRVCSSAAVVYIMMYMVEFSERGRATWLCPNQKTPLFWNLWLGHIFSWARTFSPGPEVLQLDFFFDYSFDYSFDHILDHILDHIFST